MTAYIDLTMTPNRSLPRGGARLLVAGVAGVFALGSLRLALLGAWPVIAFLVLDLALLAWALKASRRSGLATEVVRLDDAQLTIRRTAPGGAERRVALEPHWARACLERISPRENRLYLASGSRRVRVGVFLSPAEREEVFRVLEDGLARYRARAR